MSFLRQLFFTLAALAIFSPTLISAKAVFAHYMLGDVTQDHSQQDITDAAAMGFDAFAVNIQDPSQPWTGGALDRLFKAANKGNLKLFFSLDLDANSKWQDFVGIMSGYVGNPAYFKATPNGFPMISTFGAGFLGPDQLKDLKNAFANEIYFAPGADMTQGYYDAPDKWFDAWKGTIDGTFSWNAAWPWRCDSNPNNLIHAYDNPVMIQAKNYKKGYMMGLSTHQYKRITGQHFYRAGEEQMPARMNYILSLGGSNSSGTYAPDFVQYISWNDAGESHYIGNIWPEAVGTDVLKYGNSQNFDHSAWKPLISSFIVAYKSGAPALSSTTALGSIWYRPILKAAACASDPQGKPTGWQGARDAVAYSFILPAGAQGYKLNLLGKTVDMTPGLNSGAIEGLAAGAAPSATVTDGAGNVVLAAQGSVPVTADSTDICNFNFAVVGAKTPGGSATAPASPTNRVGLVAMALRGVKTGSN